MYRCNLPFKFLPLLEKKVWDKRDLVPKNWKNNNAERINHVLKRKTDWKHMSNQTES